MQQSQRNKKLQLLLTLLSPGGRVGRLGFCLTGFAATTAFYILFIFLERLFGSGTQVTLVLYPAFFWAAFVLSARRYHDLDKSAWWLLLLLIPLLGPLWVSIALCFLKGTAGANRHGRDPLVRPDYMVVD